jgi:hypothetical protein
VLVGRICRQARASTPRAGLVTRAAQAALIRCYLRLESAGADLIASVRALDGIVRAAKALRMLDEGAGWRHTARRRRATPQREIFSMHPKGCEDEAAGDPVEQEQDE